MIELTNENIQSENCGYSHRKKDFGQQKCEFSQQKVDVAKTKHDAESASQRTLRWFDQKQMHGSIFEFTFWGIQL